MLKCDFNKVGLLCNFIEIALQGVPVNLLHIFRTTFLKNTSWRLLLYVFMSYSVQSFIIYEQTKLEFIFMLIHSIPAGIYMFKVNNKHTRKMCEIRSKFV